MKKQLCEALLSWRLENRFSQTAMADKLGVSQTTYHKWESCKCEIPLKYFMKISSIIQIPLQEIIPEDLEVFVPDLPRSKTETIQFSAMEMLRVVEMNNKLLQEKINMLEAEIESLRNKKNY